MSSLVCKLIQKLGSTADALIYVNNVIEALPDGAVKDKYIKVREELIRDLEQTEC